MHEDLERIKESIKVIEMRLTLVLDHLVLLNLQGKQTMATFDELQAEMTSITETVAAERVQVQEALAAQAVKIQALLDQIAAGVPAGSVVTQEQVDTLMAIAQSIKATVADIITV